MRCEGFPVENYSFFVLGNLPADEREEIRSHLDLGCEVCREEIRHNQALWHAVALSAAPVEPSRALRRRVREMVRPRRARRLVWTWPQALAATSFAIAAAVTGWMLAPRPVPQTQLRTITVPGPADTASLRTLERENQNLRLQIAKALNERSPPSAAAPDRELPALRAQLAQAAQDSARLAADLAASQGALQEANRKYLAAAQPPSAPVNPAVNQDQARSQTAALQARAQELERQVIEYKALLAAEHRKLESSVQLATLLNEPGLTLVRLRATEKGRNVEAHAFVTAGSQVVFYASQLPALPAGRTYQLWLIRANGPAIVSAGTFNPDARNRATLQFANTSLTSGITALAVTDEPSGGSATPTGHKLLVGQNAPA
jgi:anti-sigma-K factor RskA